MEKDAIKDLVYGGLEELLHNRNLYYYSSVGPNYSHFTEQGQAAVLEYLNMMSHKILEVEERDLDTRARQQVIKGLTSE